ncbi:hypothetical protein J3458_000235 [Metarhizium acridum]|uniref:uncharacterized protein n=1 Tax=Metarhizium acridum TaxID=92637 RepID=UPI001C6AE587|nr:hypothetical protein J3458_000235 [Metarhizium acridum]
MINILFSFTANKVQDPACYVHKIKSQVSYSHYTKALISLAKNAKHLQHVLNSPKKKIPVSPSHKVLNKVDIDLPGLHVPKIWSISKHGQRLYSHAIVSAPPLALLLRPSILLQSNV